MPRQARLDIPGARHHIMIRGIHKSAIFKDDRDKTLFMERLGQQGIEGKCAVYARAIMGNHVRLLFKSGQLRSRGRLERPHPALPGRLPDWEKKGVCSRGSKTIQDTTYPQSLIF